MQNDFFSKNSFLFLFFAVIFTQFFLLKPILGQGFTHEDYVGIFSAKSLSKQIFADPVNTWITIGPHNASHSFYIAFLDLFFKENYNMYLYTSILIKIAATLLLYPLIFLISKNKLFAFLTTFLYGISYPSAGALYLYVVGNEYLGLAFMNLFLISYYFSIKKGGVEVLLTASFTITLAYLFSSIRIFPIFAIILLIESFILYKEGFSRFIIQIQRLTSIFLPVIIVTLASLNKIPEGNYGLTTIPPFLNLISDGNFFLLLNPLWGLGYLMLPASYFRFLGGINLSNLFTYLTSPLPILILLFSLCLSFLLSKRPYKFFLHIVLINLFLGGLTFLLLTFHTFSPPRVSVDYSSIIFYFGEYAGIISTFILSIASTCLFQWYATKKQNLLLLVIAISPFFSLLFIIGQWLFTQQLFMYQEGLHRYLVIPEIGMSIFLSAIIMQIYKNRKITIWSLTPIVFILCFLFLISKNEISRVFQTKKNAGADLRLQELMRTQVLNTIPPEKLKNDMLFFFKLSTGSEPVLEEDIFDWKNLTYWVHLKKGYLTNNIVDGCVGFTQNILQLKKMSTVQDGSKGFLYKDAPYTEARCFHEGIQYSLEDKFISVENFYAFTIEKNKLKNITSDTVHDIFE